MSTGLAGVFVIELDTNKDLLTWAFPSLDPAIDTVLKDRCGLREASGLGSFVFSRFGSHWQYFLSSAVDSDVTKVKAVSIVVQAEAYNPPKYSALLEVFMKAYKTANICSAVLQPFLVAFASDKWAPQVFDPRAALVSPVHTVVEALGLDIAAVWTAMLTKQRVFVYHPDPAQLVDFVRSMPAIGTWHRQNWSIVRPLCTLGQAEVDELKSLGVYVAGFTTPAALNLDGMWDLFVDASARTVTISEKAKQQFVMAKYHKSIADAFVKAVEAAKTTGSDPAQATIKTIMLKTKELLDQLASCKDAAGIVTQEGLAAQKLPPNLDSFLYNVAVAEGLTGSAKKA